MSLRRPLARLALGLLVLAAGARADEPSGPRLALDPELVDFGRVLQQRELRAQVRLRNFGDREWVLHELSADCDCAAALLDQQGRRLAPGASATLDVRLETRRFLGRVVRHVRLRSNDVARPVVSVELVAEVLAGRR